MKILHSLDELPELNEAHITIGNYDGIHIGHQQIMDTLRNKAGNNSKVAITFEKAPAEFLKPGSFKGYIFPKGYKKLFLEKYGFDIVLSLNFEDVVSIKAEQFIEILLKKFKNLHLYVGYNFKFGKNNHGNADYLKKVALKHNFSVHIIPQVLYNHTPVSSSTIRNLIRDGKMEDVAGMLGRPYFICSSIVPGNCIGSKIGFPTLNLGINRQVVPQSGIFFTFYYLDKEFYPSMTYLGKRPTLTSRELRNETNIIDFDNSGDRLNMQKVHTILFIRKTRDEKRFHNVEELQKNIYNDKEKILELYHKYDKSGLNGLKEVFIQWRPA
jgi:riboflavin kinase / FMN adenylyltransferase